MCTQEEEEEEEEEEEAEAAEEEAVGYNHCHGNGMHRWNCFGC